MHSVQLDNKSQLKISGVEGVAGLTDTLANIIIEGEMLEIKGSNLKCEKLSVETGELIIVGQITAILYKEKPTKKSLLKRLLK